MTTLMTTAPREHWLRRWQQARERLAPLFGMNRRNVELVYAHNERRHYPLADDKIVCKELLQAIGVPVAPTIAIGRGLFEVDALLEQLREREDFVVKPASGSGGDGIIVIGKRTDDRLADPQGPTDRGPRAAPAPRQHHLRQLLEGDGGPHPDRGADRAPRALSLLLVRRRLRPAGHRPARPTAAVDGARADPSLGRPRQPPPGRHRRRGRHRHGRDLPRHVAGQGGRDPPGERRAADRPRAAGRGRPA
jgi:hypothetical protein